MHGRHVNRVGQWIRQAFGSRPVGDSANDPSALDLAVAVLLLEVLRADYEVGAAERRQVVASIRDLLGLEAGECEQLLERAERRIDQSHDLYQFTSEVNRSYSAADKQRLIEGLWRVATADAVVHKYEEHLIRRVADLLHVPHRDFIAAKLKTE